MAIKLSFEVKKRFSKRHFFIEIVGKKILYTDLLNTRLNLVPKMTKDELAEYDRAKTEEEIAEICIKDCIKKGAKLVKKE